MDQDFKENLKKLLSAYFLSIKGNKDFNLDEVEKSYKISSDFVINEVEVKKDDQKGKDEKNFFLEYYKYLYVICKETVNPFLNQNFIQSQFKSNIFKNLLQLWIYKNELFKEKAFYKKYKDIVENVFIADFMGLQYFFDYKVKKHNYKRTETLFLLGTARLLVIMVLKSLNVRFNTFERKVAHYTRVDVANFIINDDKFFRMNSTEFMNDPTEGLLVKEFLSLKTLDSYIYQHNFLSCFTFNHNYLNQFRLYGRTKGLDGTGVSLVLNESFFDKLNRFYFNDDEVELELHIGENNKLPLFRCCYFDPKSEYISIAKRSKFSFFQEFKGQKSADEIEKIWTDYMGLIKPIESDIRNNLNYLKIVINDLKKLYYTGDERVWNIIDDFMKPINYLFKHSAFKEEEECRIIKVTNLNDKSIKNELNADGQTFTYIEYPADLKESLVNIYIGPASAKYLTYFKTSLLKKRKKEVKICVSDNPLRI